MQNIFTDFEHPTFGGQKNTTQISSWKIMTHLWLFVTFKKNKTALAPTQTPKSFIMEFQK